MVAAEDHSAGAGGGGCAAGTEVVGADGLYLRGGGDGDVAAGAVARLEDVLQEHRAARGLDVVRAKHRGGDRGA